MRRAMVVAMLLAAACDNREQPRPVRQSTPEELAAAKKARDDEAARASAAAAAADTIVARIKRGATTEADVKELSADADKNKAITFAHLKKNADKYAGDAWRLRGKILEISEKDGQSVARVALDSYGSNVVLVVAPFETDFVEGNRVEVLGVLTGSYSYTSQAGWNITIPSMLAASMTKPKAPKPMEIPGLQRLPD